MIPGLSLSVKMPVGYFMRILGLGQSKWNGRQIAEFLIISHHSWFSDTAREILHQTEPGCFSVGSMHSGFHSSPGCLLTNEFENDCLHQTLTPRRTILFATRIMSSFLEPVPRLIDTSYLWAWFFCEHGSLSFHCLQGVEVLSWSWCTQDSRLTQKTLGLHTPFHKLH